MKPNQTSSMVVLMGLSLATSPFIISILLLKVMEEWLQGMGEFSEEFFRSEQLPLLNFPPNKSSR